jgi:hypothetical protein
MILNRPLRCVKIYRKYYSLRPILLSANMDLSTIKMCLDMFILAKSIMGRREYMKCRIVSQHRCHRREKYDLPIYTVGRDNIFS